MPWPSQTPWLICESPGRASPGSRPPCGCAETLKPGGGGKGGGSQPGTSPVIRSHPDRGAGSDLRASGLEQRRLSVLKAAGLEQATVSQLLEQEDNEGKERLSPVFEELTQAAGRLRETKESADRILNVRLRQIQHISGLSGGPHYDEYG
ncbi:hypothetical protein [Enterocloster sp.]|uniref:hypothetical protein n=1 Tax=Enterocloster sp. TaxID=2719315 RepID=UPI0039A0C8C3